MRNSSFSFEQKPGGSGAGPLYDENHAMQIVELSCSLIAGVVSGFLCEWPNTSTHIVIYIPATI